MLVQTPLRVVAKCRVEQTPFGWRLFGVETLSYESEPMKEFLSALKDEVRLQFMRRRPDLLWFHGAALKRGECAVVICGESGQGKSSIAVDLVGSGWELLSDDIVPIGPDGAIRPFPQTPEVRVHPGVEVRPKDVANLSRKWVSLSATQVSHQPASVQSFFFLEYDAAIDARVISLETGSVAFQLLRHLMNFPDHKIRAVERAADIATCTPGYRLTYSSPASAGLLVDSKFRN
jgi:hypothetical protein